MPPCNSFDRRRLCSTDGRGFILATGPIKRAIIAVETVLAGNDLGIFLVNREVEVAFSIITNPPAANDKALRFVLDDDYFAQLASGAIVTIRLEGKMVGVKINIDVINFVVESLAY